MASGMCLSGMRRTPRGVIGPYLGGSDDPTGGLFPNTTLGPMAQSPGATPPTT
jgi:hypothetical protein